MVNARSRRARARHYPTPPVPLGAEAPLTCQAYRKLTQHKRSCSVRHLGVPEGSLLVNQMPGAEYEQLKLGQTSEVLRDSNVKIAMSTVETFNIYTYIPGTDK